MSQTVCFQVTYLLHCTNWKGKKHFKTSAVTWLAFENLRLGGHVEKPKGLEARRRGEDSRLAACAWGPLGRLYRFILYEFAYTSTPQSIKISGMYDPKQAKPSILNSGEQIASNRRFDVGVSSVARSESSDSESASGRREGSGGTVKLFSAAVSGMLRVSATGLSSLRRARSGTVPLVQPAGPGCRGARLLPGDPGPLLSVPVT